VKEIEEEEEEEGIVTLKKISDTGHSPPLLEDDNPYYLY
jgi:hypothetical protein